MIVTIDGPSGTGKSSVAKEVARRLGIVYFDTGAMYRAVTWMALDRGIAPKDASGLEAALQSFSFSIERDGDDIRYYVGKQDVTEALRTVELTQHVSAVSAHPVVRQAVVRLQKDFAATASSIFEGRDMGSVVFPQAEVKIYLTASPEVRGQRRYDQIRSAGKEPPPLEEVIQQIKDRDIQDSTRALSPLCVPEGATEIDTSSMTFEEVVTAIIREIEK